MTAEPRRTLRKEGSVRFLEPKKAGLVANAIAYFTGLAGRDLQEVGTARVGFVSCDEFFERVPRLVARIMIAQDREYFRGVAVDVEKKAVGVHGELILGDRGEKVLDLALGEQALVLVEAVVDPHGVTNDDGDDLVVLCEGESVREEGYGERVGLRTHQNSVREHSAADGTAGSGGVTRRAGGVGDTCVGPVTAGISTMVAAVALGRQDDQVWYD